MDYKNHEIIIVDNGSTDDSLNQLHAIENITVISSGANLGFAGGCNIGIRQALSTGCQYIWLLNNDTTVLHNSLSALIRQAKSLHNQCLVGSTIIHPDGLLQCYGGGTINHWLGVGRSTKNLTKIDKLDFLCGASLFIPVNIIHSIGLLNDNLFLYWEDAEFCARAITNGFKLSLAADSIIYHSESSSSNKVPLNKIYYFNQSAAIVYLLQNKYAPIVLGTLLRLFKNLIKLRFKAACTVVKGVYSGWKKYHAIS
ncbi:MAG: rhamnosyltransferase [Gammaproteobacteria bacterium]|nr:rhamnosyltransferase [Gammaproteobacteria bacterium]